MASHWNDQNTDDSGSDKDPFDQHSDQRFDAGSDNGSDNSLQGLPDPDDLTDYGYGFWDNHQAQGQDLLPGKAARGTPSPRKRKGEDPLPEPTKKKSTRLSAYHLQDSNGSAASASSQSHQQDVQAVDKQTADLFSIDLAQLHRERELHEERAKNLKSKNEKIRRDAKKIKKLEGDIVLLRERLDHKQKELSRELNGNDYLNGLVHTHHTSIDRLRDALEES